LNVKPVVHHVTSRL